MRDSEKMSVRKFVIDFLRVFGAESLVLSIEVRRAEGDKQNGDI